MIFDRIDPLGPATGIQPGTFLAVADALYRFAAGQDLRDAELFRSAWTEDAELDFTQPAAALGASLPPFRGRDDIVPAILATLETIVTTHTVTNPRIAVQGDRARLHALVEAQHVLRANPARRLLLKNHYDCELRNGDALWRIARMRITMAWKEGDASVLFPLPSPVPASAERSSAFAPPPGR